MNCAQGMFLLLATLIALAPLDSRAQQDEDGEELRYGAQASLNHYTIEDPDGPTASASGASISAIVLMPTGRNRRVMFQLNRESFSLKGSTTHIAQDITSLSGGLSYQALFRVTRKWKPWVGIGAGYASIDYENRYTLTPGGFSRSLPNRSSTDFSVLLNANTEWQFNKDWDLGVQVQLAKSIQDDASTLRIGVYAVY